MAYEIYQGGANHGLAVERRQWYEKQLLIRAIPKFVYNKYTYKKNIPKHGGRGIQFRRFERLSVGGTGESTLTTALTEGSTGAEVQGTFTEVILTLNQYGQYAILSDMALAQTQDELMSEYTANFGESAADALDQLARTAFLATTTIQYASTATARDEVGSGMTLTAAEIREAVRTLRRNNAPEIAGSGYVAIIHPDTWFDFIGDSDIVNAYQNAGPRSESNPLFTGELFRWMGVTFEVTSNAPKEDAVSGQVSPGISGAAVYQTLVFGDQAVGASEFDALALSMHVKALGSSGTDDPLDQRATVGWKASFAAGVLQDNFIVNIEHNASISQNGAQSSA